ncbi:DUF6283 family protein [Sinorhizobium terangae]|uniref:DUF6283 family protein n=1 Tax=Sinorhizobium terangae TaxID=110322 RepID=UPI0024B175F6|nr:DUF6283 family protein [Sinorhizobium terangae]WFU51161.1 DUF6283 family protein [Sinorhizobium terangae]
MRKVKQTSAFDCGDGEHQVVSLSSSAEEKLLHRHEPCEECPWREDRRTGVFPAEAFRHSASTAYDMAPNSFACQMSGKEKPATCAGFLLRGAEHNLGVRLAIIAGRYDPRTVRSDVPLYKSYREMAEANGVSPDDPALEPCRGVDERWPRR